MTARDKAVEFVNLCRGQGARQYNTWSADRGIVEKIFNKRRGSLALYRFGAGNRVTVNTGFERKCDRKRLMAFMPGAEVVVDSLEYPRWYFEGLKDPDIA